MLTTRPVAPVINAVGAAILSSTVQVQTGTVGVVLMEGFGLCFFGITKSVDRIDGIVMVLMALGLN